MGNLPYLKLKYNVFFFKKKKRMWWEFSHACSLYKSRKNKGSFNRPSSKWSIGKNLKSRSLLFLWSQV